MEQRPAAGTGGEERVSDAVRVQILATEHWSLLATRTLVWSEAFSRAGIFLTVLSAAAVALALVAQTGGSDQTFRLFALLLLPVVLFLGLATFVRLGWINDRDSQLIIGMNRLRRGYLDTAPDLEPYFVTGATDDLPGIMRTAAMGDDQRRNLALQVLVSTPAVVGVIDCALAGVLGGLVGDVAGLSTAGSVAVGAACGTALLALLVVVPARSIRLWNRTYRPRFPG